MNKKAKQLRELRNKIIYNDDVPLDRGVEVLLKENPDDLIGYTTTWVVRDLRWEGSDTVVKLANEDIVSWNSPYIKILGKPTSWGDVLRMLKEKETFGWYVLESGGRLLHFLDYKDCSATGITRFDLTRSPEEQDEEVLDKLINLLKINK